MYCVEDVTLPMPLASPLVFHGDHLIYRRMIYRDALRRPKSEPPSYTTSSAHRGHSPPRRTMHLPPFERRHDVVAPHLQVSRRTVSAAVDLAFRRRAREIQRERGCLRLRHPTPGVFSGCRPINLLHKSPPRCFLLDTFFFLDTLFFLDERFLCDLFLTIYIYNYYIFIYNLYN